MEFNKYVQIAGVLETIKEIEEYLSSKEEKLVYESCM